PKIFWGRKAPDHPQNFGYNPPHARSQSQTRGGGCRLGKGDQGPRGQATAKAKATTGRPKIRFGCTPGQSEKAESAGRATADTLAGCERSRDLRSGAAVRRTLSYR